MHFDIQRTKELFEGWNDDTYGASKGLDYIVKSNDGIDVIIGGPPCQAYSIAGRVRDANGMKDDYRNYLFESYLHVVNRYQPKAFIFENVPGILSAKPSGTPIIDTIKQSFYDSGYIVLSNLSEALIEMSEYGVPQKRKRIIILGLNVKYFGLDKCQKLLNSFYHELLPQKKVSKVITTREAIGDLPKLFPMHEEKKYQGKKISHTLPVPFVNNHVARWQNKRDIEIFRLLAHDIETGKNQYISTESLKRLYTEKTGKTSSVHKYHVLRWDEPSNLIPAHLYKDGLRHIHPDSKQARTITVREAARLQTFDDDYVFVGSNTDTYKMIGNAVPPRFSKVIAETIYELLFK